VLAFGKVLGDGQMQLMFPDESLAVDIGRREVFRLVRMRLLKREKVVVRPATVSEGSQQVSKRGSVFSNTPLERRRVVLWRRDERQRYSRESGDQRLDEERLGVW
jgi:hypothetical protein